MARDQGNEARKRKSHDRSTTTAARADVGVRAGAERDQIQLRQRREELQQQGNELLRQYE